MPKALPVQTWKRLIDRGLVQAEPITYEDFLPVSAAGIFQSNLGGEEQKQYQAHAAQQGLRKRAGRARA